MAQFNLKKFADFGSGEPFAARVWITFPEIWHYMDLEAKEDDLKFSFSRVAESLSVARSHLLTIEAPDFSERPVIDAQREYNAFYNAVWLAYKDRFQNFMKLMGYDIGFMFVVEKNFKKDAEEFKKQHPNKKMLVDIAAEARSSWQTPLMQYRNNQHTGDRRGEEVDLESPKTAREIFDVVWQQIELIFFYLAEEKLNKSFTILEIPEKDRDPAIPRRFKVTLRPEVAKRAVEGNKENRS